MSFSLFANKNLHTEEIKLFREVHPTGAVHTSLTTFPAYVRSTPSIYVFESRELITGSDKVMVFLKERAPKKEKAIRTPRSMVKDRSKTNHTVKIKDEGDLASSSVSAKTVNKQRSSSVSVQTEAEESGDLPVVETETKVTNVVPTYTVENTETVNDKKDESTKSYPESSMEPLKKPRKRSSRAKKEPTVSTE